MVQAFKMYPIALKLFVNKEKNKTTKNPRKFKINVLGAQIVNGTSIVSITETSKTQDLSLF